MPIGRKPISTTEFAWKGATFAGELCVDTARACEVKSSQVKSTKEHSPHPWDWYALDRELWIGWHPWLRSSAMRGPRRAGSRDESWDPCAPACVACSCDRTEHRWLALHFQRGENWVATAILS